jgi:hypothetical protein
MKQEFMQQMPITQYFKINYCRNSVAFVGRQNTGACIHHILAMSPPPPQLPNFFGDYNRYLSPHKTVVNNEAGLTFAVTTFLELYSYKFYLFTQLMSASMT